MCLQTQPDVFWGTKLLLIENHCDSVYYTSQQTFSLKSQIVNAFSFVGEIIFAVAVQRCCCKVETAIENMKTNGNDYVLIKLYV